MSLYPELSAHTVIPVDGCQHFCERMYPKLRWKKEKHLEETTLRGNDFHIPPKKMETCKIIDLKGAKNGKESKQSTIDFHEAKCVPFNDPCVNDLFLKPNEGIWTQWRYMNPSLTSNVNIYIYMNPRSTGDDQFWLVPSLILPMPLQFNFDAIPRLFPHATQQLLRREEDGTINLDACAVGGGYKMRDC